MTEEKKPAAGGKLDVQKIGEYLNDTEAEWDTANWSRWTVTGRVLPERSGVRFPNRNSRSVSAAGRISVDLEVQASHLIARIASEKAELSVFELVEITRTHASFPVNYIAFMNRGAYEVVIDVATNDRTGKNETLPIFDPIFDIEDTGRCFKAGQTEFEIPYAAANYQLVTALQDLTQAIRQPRRTFEHCRMAIEVMRNYFDPPDTKDGATRHRQGEDMLSVALAVERKTLTRLDALAARSRHGDLVISMDWPLRKRVLEFAWEVAARFAHYLDHGSSEKSWTFLDAEFEVYNPKPGSKKGDILG